MSSDVDSKLPSALRHFATMIPFSRGLTMISVATTAAVDDDGNAGGRSSMLLVKMFMVIGSS